MSETLPVLIVGAGPTGLTAAMELSRLGIPVRLVDKLAKFKDTSRAIAVQARTLELLQHAPSSLLDTYQAERLPVISKLVERTEGATDAFTADSRFVHD